MASQPYITAAAPAPLQNARRNATIHSLADARRTALLRRLWAEHDGEGRAI